MAKPNYQFEKRRREMDQQRKKEEKRQRKLAERQAKPNDPSHVVMISAESASGESPT